MRRSCFLAPMVLLALSSPVAAASGVSGMITKPSNYSVPQTIQRFEDAVKAGGWMVFAELDHAAAATRAGLTLQPRTVIVFGNPKAGTAAMQKFPTLAIDLPTKALVWQDDQGKVWLTYNSADYLGTTVYPRHGATMPDDSRQAFQQFLEKISDQATK